jgi:hypothetical protein
LDEVIDDLDVDDLGVSSSPAEVTGEGDPMGRIDLRARGQGVASPTREGSAAM